MQQELYNTVSSYLSQYIKRESITFFSLFEQNYKLQNTISLLLLIAVFLVADVFGTYLYPIPCLHEIDFTGYMNDHAM